jgi:hypothetical protein
MKPVATRLNVLALHASAPQMKSSVLIRYPKRIPIKNQSSRNNQEQQKSHNAQRKPHSLVVSKLQL